MKLYRAISQGEKDSYDLADRFETSARSLEAKQFFKSRKAVESFVARSVLQDYDPPYLYLLIVTLFEGRLVDANPDEMELDGFEAVSISEEHLDAFNNCVNFVEQEVL